MDALRLSILVSDEYSTMQQYTTPCFVFTPILLFRAGSASFPAHACTIGQDITVTILKVDPVAFFVSLASIILLALPLLWFGTRKEKNKYRWVAIVAGMCLLIPSIVILVHSFHFNVPE